MSHGRSTLLGWQDTVKNCFFDDNSFNIDLFNSTDSLSGDAYYLVESAFYCLTTDKGTSMHNFGYVLAEYAIEISTNALATNGSADMPINYRRPSGENELDILAGRSKCAESLALARWIVDSKPNPDLFKQAAENAEAYYIAVKQKHNLIDEIPRLIYMTSDKDRMIDLYKRYSKKVIDLNTIKYPIMKMSTFYYYLMNFPISDYRNGNLYHDKVITSSLKYYYRLITDWRVSRPIRLLYNELMVLAYIYGQYVTGKTAPADFLQDIRDY